jgi:hypothetical protein
MNKMKTLRLFVLIILVNIWLGATAQYDSIFAEVSHDTVTLWQTATYRNCVSYFSMEIEQNEYNVTWYQIYINTIWTSCNCFFDLSVTFLVPSVGNYHADVYSFVEGYPEDPVYEGSVDFTVGDRNSPVRSEIIGQYQSDCYHNVRINEEETSGYDFILYPNPLKDGYPLNIEAFSTGMTVLEIFTLTGERIFCRKYDANQKIQDRFIKEELFPVPGIYVVRLRNDDQVFVRKITVL